MAPSQPLSALLSAPSGLFLQAPEDKPDPELGPEWSLPGGSSDTGKTPPLWETFFLSSSFVFSFFGTGG